MVGLDGWLLAAGALLGAVVGSFLNVVIYRLPNGTFFSGGARSRCANPACGAPIAWYDNLPIVGWLLLRGRARCCGARISARYPAVELLTAVLFAALCWLAPGGPLVVDGRVDGAAVAAFLLYAFFVATLIANTFIDIDHRILPDALTKTTVVVGLVGALLVPGFPGAISLLGVSPAVRELLFAAAGAAVGYGLTDAVRRGARALFRREAMGYGDVKLMAGIGAFLGWEGVVTTFFLGSVYGAVVGVVHRRLTGDAYIFFGPFLAAGALTTLLAGDVLDRMLRGLQDWQRSGPSAAWVAAITAVLCLVSLFVLVRRGRAS